MQHKEFEQIATNILSRVKHCLTAKGIEYSKSDSVFFNFEEGGKILGNTKEQTLLYYMSKHIVSIVSMIKDDKEKPMEVWQEKITDIICYLILLEAMKHEENNS